MRSWKVGSVLGIGLYLHWTLVLLPVWVVFATAQTDLGPLFYLPAVAVLFGCVMLHELGHALAARCFGIGTRDITMYPIGGVARLERMSEKPLEEFVIAIAGPAVNVVIALLLAAVLLPLTAAGGLGFLESLPGKFLQFLLASNVVLVVFNLIPAFPMDGGRVFRALLSAFVGHLHATRIAAGVAAGVALLMGLVGLGVFSHAFDGNPFLEGIFQGSPLLVFVAGFVFLMGQRELQMVEMRERARHEEPLMVLPVRRPRPVGEPELDLRPTIAVYTWDQANGIWVREGASRPVRRVYRPDPESNY